MKPCDKNIKKTLKLAEEMLDLADNGDAVREDAGCGVLYGVLRDSAYKIRKLAETEKEAHMKRAGGTYEKDGEKNRGRRNP